MEARRDDRRPADRSEPAKHAARVARLGRAIAAIQRHSSGHPHIGTAGESDLRPCTNRSGRGRLRHECRRSRPGGDGRYHGVRLESHRRRRPNEDAGVSRTERCVLPRLERERGRQDGTIVRDQLRPARRPCARRQARGDFRVSPSRLLHRLGDECDCVGHRPGSLGTAFVDRRIRHAETNDFDFHRLRPRRNRRLPPGARSRDLPERVPQACAARCRSRIQRKSGAAHANAIVNMTTR